MFRKLATLGLDIGTCSIKTAIVNPDNKKTEYLEEQDFFIEREFLEDIQEKQKIKETIKTMVEKAKAAATRYSLALASTIHKQGIICRYMNMPKLSDKELATAVPSSAHKHIPFSLNEVMLSFVKVPPMVPSKDTTGVLFFAIHKDIIEEHKELISDCGLKEERLEIPALAIARECISNNTLPPDKFYAIVQTGFRYTHVVIMRNGYPYYTRDFSIGGGDFTHAFQMWKQNGWKEAELEKRNYDVSQNEVAIEPFLSNWENEIKKALRFFTSQVKETNISVEKIYLTGGSSALKGLNERLQNFVNIPVETDAFNKLKTDNKYDLARHNGFKSAIGLSL